MERFPCEEQHLKDRRRIALAFDKGEMAHVPPWDTLRDPDHPILVDKMAEEMGGVASTTSASDQEGAEDSATQSAQQADDPDELCQSAPAWIWANLS